MDEYRVGTIPTVFYIYVDRLLLYNNLRFTKCKPCQPLIRFTPHKSVHMYVGTVYRVPVRYRSSVSVQCTLYKL